MKNLLILIAFIFNFTTSAQTIKDVQMFNLTNQVRTDPKSFIPVVEAYIKKLETRAQPFANIDIKGAVVTKKTNNGKNAINPLIAEAKSLIIFLNTVKPVKALNLSSDLASFAKTQALHNDSVKTLSHDGDQKIKGYTVGGENCTTGLTASDALLSLLIDYGNPAKGHRTNIFLTDFTKIGIANQNNFWVQDFGY